MTRARRAAWITRWQLLASAACRCGTRWLLQQQLLRCSACCLAIGTRSLVQRTCQFSISLPLLLLHTTGASQQVVLSLSNFWAAYRGPEVWLAWAEGSAAGKTVADYYK